MRHHLDRLLSSGSADDVWAAFTDSAHELGYAHACYSFRRFADMSQLWHKEDMEWRSTYPAEFEVQLNSGSGLMHASPWSRWSRNNTGARSFAWIDTPDAAPYLDQDGHKLIDLMRQHDLLAGHCISLRGVAAHVSGTIVLSTGAGTDQGHADARWTECGDWLQTICKIMHLRICALPQTTGSGQLTPRQREVVEWAAQGKTAAEIADILGVEATTIEKHLRLARESLGAGTTAQAILHAYQRRQIFVRPRTDDSSS